MNAIADRPRAMRAAFLARAASAAIALTVLTPAAFAAPTFSVGTQFGGISLRDHLTLPDGDFVTPPDMAGGVSADYVMQSVNFSTAIFDRAGNRLSFKTNQQFFAEAGIAGTTAADRPFNPRITYDPRSERWFMSAALDRGLAGNPVLLAVSKSANPLDGFQAVEIATPAGSNNLFPTMGVNAETVTFATDNFGTPPAFAVSILSVPKADLIGAAPSVANIARFDNIDQTISGFSIQAVNSVNDPNGRHAIIGTDVFEFFEIARHTVETGGGAPTLTTQDKLVAEFDGFPTPGRQPGGATYNTVGDRIGAQTYQWGDFIYSARGVSDPSFPQPRETAAVHWMIMRESTNTIVAEGVIADPDLDFSIPSIAANAAGNFVVAFNGSGPDQRIAAYAVACTFNELSVASCGAPTQVAEGQDDNYRFAPDFNRWGSYSAVQLDPTDPLAFWLFQQIPDLPELAGIPEQFTGRWDTIVTQIMVDRLAVPAPGAALLFGLGLAGLAALGRCRVGRA